MLTCGICKKKNLLSKINGHCGSDECWEEFYKRNPGLAKFVRERKKMTQGNTGDYEDFKLTVDRKKPK